MRRLIILGMTVLPLGFSMGCDVTGRQLQDFVFTTGVRVFVQTAVSLINAAILQGAGK